MIQDSQHETKSDTMRLHERMRIRLFSMAVLISGLASAQTTSSEPAPKHPKKHTSAGRDIGSGAGDIGKGPAKGAVRAGVGTGKAALDLVTLHPLNAATDAGKGAVSAGKSVGIGAAKGSAKIVKGAGKALKHLF